MNVLFLSLIGFESFSEHNIYADMLREFIKNGHKVYCVSPVEKRLGQQTHTVEENGSYILRLKTGNTQKVNMIEKGISTLLIQSQVLAGIKKYFSGVKFDLVLYSTPPITFANVIEYIKKRDGAKSYLMLKDIFPQNSLDLGLISKSGIKGVIYRYFRRKEKKLYTLSDKIGCMSQANADYILKHNSDISHDRVEICPNAIEPVDVSLSQDEKQKMRERMGFPQDKKLFVYGGNLGRPQDVPFIIKCIEACSEIDDAYFVIAGSGTDRHYISQFVESKCPENLKLLDFVPKDEYDKMIACCDVGLIFLDYRFTIPNYPSRLLSYMQARLPVIACTDSVTDVGKTVTEARCGWQCASNDTSDFVEKIREISESETSENGCNGWQFLNDNFTSAKVYETILNAFSR